MTRVLFVDDEPKVLSGLRRIMLTEGEDFDALYAESAHEALRILEKETIDIIVSDMRMPEMTGAELLHTVHEKYPQMARIIMSGQSERNEVLKTVGESHQYLAKPCESETLLFRLREIKSLRKQFRDSSLVQMISDVDTLPAMPGMYRSIVEELRSTEPSIKRISEIIGNDVSMSAKILKLVNSAYFGISNPVSNPLMAVNMLGLNTLKTLVLTLNVFSEFDSQIIPEFKLDALQNHSLAVGSLARDISRKANLSHLADEAFTAGLLHDVGMIILAANFAEEYRSILAEHAESGTMYYTLEENAFGVNHGPVAGYLFSLWALPHEVIKAITFHHRPEKALVKKIDITAILHVANAFVEPFSARRLKEPVGISEEFLSSLEGGSILMEAARNSVEH